MVLILRCLIRTSFRSSLITRVLSSPTTSSMSSYPAAVNPPEQKPSKVELAAGEAKWACMCGQSKTFPWCDGSHRDYNAANGTDFKPSKVGGDDEAKTHFICQCGKSANRPFCDGTHRK